MSELETPQILLAMETSGDVCGVAVLRNGQLMVEHTFRHGMHLSERLLSHVDEMLQEADTTLEQVNTLAVGIGPGSFTGTRIGVMTMKTLASVLGKSLVGISGLEALAWEYSGLRDTIVTPILPCRAGVVYACPFRVDGSQPEPLTEPAAFPLGDLAAILAGQATTSLLCCGPAAKRYESELRAALENSAQVLSFGSADFPRASAVGALACAYLTAGNPPQDPLSMVPLYISPPPISTPKKENRPPKWNPEGGA